MSTVEDPFVWEPMSGEAEATLDKPLTFVQSGATLSADEKYRYRLSRVWAPEKPRLLWVMLNPSTADAEKDDATIRKCLGFARRWGYGSIEVVNLFALRATEPRELRAKGIDPIGPENDHHIRAALAEAQQVVLAWGSDSFAVTRAFYVLRELLKDTQPRNIRCLDQSSKNGRPKHPLYAPYAKPHLHFSSALLK
jgi:hypothetical protein